MRRRRMMVMVLGAGVLGALVVLSGVVPIKASSGHWAVTSWFLHFAMKRSVSTHTLFTDVPPLDDPALVIKGATHYQLACSSCHGAPGMTERIIAAHMTPAPPDLSQTVEEWESEELFYIVKHGVKFTGMPAWPSDQRDDEVWAMVAFLEKLPQLDAAEYRRLAFGETTADVVSGSDAVQTMVANNCGRCHGADGLGRGSSAFPRIAGQRALYLRGALEAYARGDRHSGIMEPIARDLSPELMRELAEYYGALSAPAPGSSPDREAIALGESIAVHGIPGQRVPPCSECHGPRKNAAYPLLAGQHAEEIIRQLSLLKDERRGGSPYLRIMQPIAGRLRDEQMRAVALYYASQPLREIAAAGVEVDIGIASTPDNQSAVRPF